MAEDLDPGTPVAWPATPYMAPVLDKESNRIGVAASLLGDENADIFHSLVIKTGHGADIREVPADRVGRITTTMVHTDLSPEEAEALEPYSATRWFDAEWGGLFRKHPRWVEEKHP